MTHPNNPKRQHYFAQVLLRGFLAEGDDRLVVYDRQQNQYRQQRTTQVAVETHLYTISDPQTGEKHYDLEKALAVLEGKAGPAFTRLRQGEELTQDDWNAVSEYTAFQAYRTPEQISLIAELAQRGGQYALEEYLRKQSQLPREEFERKLREWEQGTGRDTTGLTQEELLRIALEGRLKAVMPKDYPISMMIEASTALAIEFSSRKWVILHPGRERAFIGSDCPVVQQVKEQPPSGYGIGPGSPGILNIFVFSRDAALAILDDKGGEIQHQSVTAGQVRQINDQVAQNSNRLIFGSSRRLLESIVKRNELDKWQPNLVFDEEAIRSRVRRLFEDQDP